MNNLAFLRQFLIYRIASKTFSPLHFFLLAFLFHSQILSHPHSISLILTTTYSLLPYLLPSVSHTHTHTHSLQYLPLSFFLLSQTLFIHTHTRTFTHTNTHTHTHTHIHNNILSQTVIGCFIIKCITDT